MQTPVTNRTNSSPGPCMVSHEDVASPSGLAIIKGGHNRTAALISAQSVMTTFAGSSGLAAVQGEDGQLRPCLFAVLGPSGAGKTTFMDILSGRKRNSGMFCGIFSGRFPLAVKR